ncbi:C1 family peptidase, partial [Patescibacteria group bacterium]|nr:C1 family peptidase [Patescibacteria group bacterium]MBU4162371.1 C1 family peptidase [Patescibacteria group bacterium]
MSKKAKFLTLALFCGCFLVANQASAASAVKPIYSMAVSGNITLNKTEGYARIILTDAQGKEYLIYEASGPFDSGSFSFENTCEETCVLNGIVPKKVDVEVLGAEIHIDKLFMIEDRTAMNARVQTMGMQTYREALGPVQEDIKIAKINQYIENSGMKWTAGKTSVSGYSYEQKKHLFISVEGTNNETPNTQGIEYYTGGIFEMAGANASPKSASASASALPSSFDWRDRHGENWMTTIKSQGECGSCWIFATTAAIEGLTNLYFNKHINIDLSEQDVLSCLYPNYDGCNLGSTQSHTISSMNYFEAFGITQERCFLYSAKDLPCENKCGNWEDYLVTSDYGEREDMLNNADIIKRKLIENGPLSVSIPYMGHAMALVGYETDPDNPTTAPIWIYKNSWGENHGEQGYLRTSFTGAEIHSIGIPIKIADNPTIEINCVDKDNDNYCNWGISEEKPSTCPASCGPKKDCDDSNSDLGTFDSNYSCIPIGVIEGDELPPVVGKIPQTNIYINVPIELSFPVSDNKRVAGCKIMVKTPNSTSFYEFETTNFSKAPCLVCYAVAENVVLTEISIITPTPYQISVYGRCWDEAGNVSTGDITEINVLSSTNPPPIIEPEFSVGKITPSTAQLNVRKRFSTMVSDDGEVLACALKINNTPVEYMNFSES